MQPQWEVADVLRQADTSLLHVSVHQQKTLRAIEQCRTMALGGHIDKCTDCGTVQISYNSCRNRHCPKCQGHKREEWIQCRIADLLPCTYYHLVFTLPPQLNALALHQPAVIYDALFKAVWQTLNAFGKNEGIQLGMIAVLHTWGQTLSLHPHLHCIVPGGGINTKGHWQKQVCSNKYLFPVKAMSKVFRAKYVHQLRASGITDKLLLNGLFSQPWVVYAKRPFAGPKQVIEYLGRYTHKVAISNHRIKTVRDNEVSFSYKDYRDKTCPVKTMTLSATEFVRRFAQHILPHRFVRIRHYGILSSSWKRGRLQKLQEQLKVHRPEQTTKTLLRKCPCCKTGTLITIEIFGKRGPPESYLRLKKLTPVQQP
jgi:Putative transposase/Transposase zinc-binding domain